MNKTQQLNKTIEFLLQNYGSKESIDFHRRKDQEDLEYFLQEDKKNIQKSD
jgi:hypothetical protein